MPGSRNTYTVLQFDEHVITALRCRRGVQGVEVLGYAVERGEWTASEASLGAALKAFAEQYALDESDVYTILPRHEMTTRVVTLPSQDEDEVKRMVRLSAEEYVPYRVEELVIDSAILNALPDGQSQVLVVLAHKDVVENHVQFLRQAGIQPAKVLASTACLASAVLAAPPKEHARYAVVNLASAGLEVLVVNNGRLDFGRGVATVQDWTMTGPNAGHVGEELIIEVRGSLAAYKRDSEDGEGVEAIYLCSDWADVTAACAKIEESLTYPCAPASFAQALVKKGGEHLECLPLVSIGAALAAQGRAAVTMELIPESLRNARARQGLQRNLVRYGGLAAAVLIALSGVYSQQILMRSAYINELREEVDAIRPVAENVIEKQRQLGILQRQVDRTGSALELLAEISAVAPESDLNFTGYTFMRGQGINLEGRARTLGEVDQFAARLRGRGEETPHLRQARITSNRNERERGETVIAYTIAIPFPEADGNGQVEVAAFD